MVSNGFVIMETARVPHSCIFQFNHGFTTAGETRVDLDNLHSRPFLIILTPS
jgi:hypothetical protein